jgi:DNA-binding MarR family transcriptional regulator
MSDLQTIFVSICSHNDDLSAALQAAAARERLLASHGARLENITSDQAGTWTIVASFTDDDALQVIDKARLVITELIAQGVPRSEFGIVTETPKGRVRTSVIAPHRPSMSTHSKIKLLEAIMTRHQSSAIIYMAALIRDTGIAHQPIKGLMDDLTDEGWITRSTEPVKRGGALLYSVTKQGEAAIPARIKALQAELQRRDPA